MSCQSINLPQRLTEERRKGLAGSQLIGVAGTQQQNQREPFLGSFFLGSTLPKGKLCFWNARCSTEPS